MNPNTLKHYLPNVLAILIVIAYYLAGQYLDFASTKAIFREVDMLTSNIILVIAAITIGLFVPQYWVVFLISGGILITTWLTPDFAALFNVTNDFIAAAILVILGFSSIAHFSRHYRSAKD
jgi:hypothetical protein